MAAEWEEVERTELSDTARLTVPGGWLYRLRLWRMEHTDLGQRRQVFTHVALTFVPEPGNNVAPRRESPVSPALPQGGERATDPGGMLAPVQCPRCGQGFREELRRFEARDIVACPSCGGYVRLELTNPEEVARILGTGNRPGP